MCVPHRSVCWRCRSAHWSRPRVACGIRFGFRCLYHYEPRATQDFDGIVTTSRPEALLYLRNGSRQLCLAAPSGCGRNDFEPSPYMREVAARRPGALDGSGWASAEELMAGRVNCDMNVHLRRAAASENLRSDRRGNRLNDDHLLPRVTERSRSQSARGHCVHRSGTPHAIGSPCPFPGG